MTIGSDARVNNMQQKDSFSVNASNKIHYGHYIEGLINLLMEIAPEHATRGDRKYGKFQEDWPSIDGLQRILILKGLRIQGLVTNGDDNEDNNGTR